MMRRRVHQRVTSLPSLWQNVKVERSGTREIYRSPGPKRTFCFGFLKLTAAATEMRCCGEAFLLATSGARQQILQMRSKAPRSYFALLKGIPSGIGREFHRT